MIHSPKYPFPQCMELDALPSRRNDAVMRRIVLIAVFILIAAGAACWYLLERQPPVERINETAPIIFFGDSLVSGVGAENNGDLVSLLSQRLGRNIINAGVPGDTTARGLARLEGDVLSKDPGLVIVLLGGNDILLKIPTAETFANLRMIVDRIQQHGGQVLLVGIRNGLFTDAYDSEFSALAAEKNIAYVEDIFWGVFGQARFMSDAIHPNTAGYEKMADRLEPVIRLFID